MSAPKAGTTPPLLAAFLTSGRGELVRQLLRSTGDAVAVVAVLRDRPSAIDDPMIPTGRRNGPTLELLDSLGIPLLDCYLPKRGSAKAARELRREENTLLALGEASVQLLCLVEYDRPLLPSGPLLQRYAPGQLLHISPTALSIVSKDKDGAAVLKVHAPLGPNSTLETLLRTFETPVPEVVPAGLRWVTAARTRSFSSEGQMWRKLYLEQGLSLTELSDLLDADRITIRTRLVICGIPIRPRGGANRSTTPLTDSELSSIVSEGIGKAARRLGLTYPALYWRVCVARRKQRQKR